MNEKIAIIGLGYVGNKVYSFFKNNDYSVHRFDIDSAKSDFKTIDELNTLNLDFAFICVPTPMADDGSCDTSIVENMVKKVRAKTIIINSTIPPGTTKKFVKLIKKDIVFIPEYFGETRNHLLDDLRERTFFIIGGEEASRKKVIDLFKYVLDSYKVRFFLVDSTTAEIIKYMENSYLATKVTFCEEFFRICEVFGVDYNQVREGWLLDPRIGPSHTFVRKDGKPGFGGKCLPKDVSAIILSSEKAGYAPDLLKAVVKYNKKNRK